MFQFLQVFEAPAGLEKFTARVEDVVSWWFEAGKVMYLDYLRLGLRLRIAVDLSADIWRTWRGLCESGLPGCSLSFPATCPRTACERELTGSVSFF